MPGSVIVVCIPVFNDWESVSMLIDRLDCETPKFAGRVSVLLVDDGSTEPAPEKLSNPPQAIERVELIHLRRNLGHQRAIALGLTFIYVNLPCSAVVVMDGDGEDAPESIHSLLDQCRSNSYRSVVFAKRARRTEALLFRIGYMSFKVVHRLLTGRRVEVGNFSVIPFELLSRLVGVSEIWNHYAAAVFQARLPVDTVPIPRAPRLKGTSKMNFISWVTHGLSAISVYGETVGVRMLCFTSILILSALVGLLAVVGIRLCTDMAIPGWATNAVGILTVTLLNLLMLTIVFVLFVLQSRNMSSFLPLRDYKYYILQQVTLHG